MEAKEITLQQITEFGEYLKNEEKSPHTVGKYIRDVRAFYKFMDGRAVTKAEVIKYKEHLISAGYAPRSVNSMVAAVNSMLNYLNMADCKVKQLRIQTRTYCSEEEELSREEYFRLIRTAGKDSRLGCILETIGSTGIRISELQYFTVENVEAGEVTVSSKNKTRTIIVPHSLQKILKRYVKKNHIESGIIFRSKNGNPLDRSNIWTWMKRLCEEARVLPSKVYPHNLRKLFARTFYRAERDIAKLADVLGHSSIDTTRIYIMSTGYEHRKRIDQLDLVIKKA